MRPIWGMLIVAGVGLTACAQNTGGAAPEPMSAAAAGPGYCQNPPPPNAEDRTRWNELCFPDG